MKTITKKLTALLIALVLMFTMAPTAFAGAEYTVEDAYEECAELYPEFVANVIAAGATETQIIRFLGAMQEYLINLDVEVTEENFETYMIEAINQTIAKRAHIDVRNALAKAYPGAVVDGMDGIISPEFEPLVETVKRIIFDNGMLEEDNGKEETDDKTEPTESTTAPTESEVKPTEPVDKPTEPTVTPTEPEVKPTEPTVTPTEPEKPTGGNNGNVGGPSDGDEDVEDTPEDVTGETETEPEVKPTEPTVTPTEPVQRPADKTFSDMNQAAWAEEAVYALVDMGVISGYPDGTFLPNKSITRAEFAKIIVVASGNYDKNATCTFTDVPQDQWYYSYVASAYKLGFITGRSETIFDPDSNITRADLCTVVYRFIKSVNPEFKATATASFADGDKIPAYAQEAVNALYGAGIVGGMGDNKFEPLTPATRAQSAKIIYGAIKAALGI